MREGCSQNSNIFLVLVLYYMGLKITTTFWPQVVDRGHNPILGELLVPVTHCLSDCELYDGVCFPGASP